MYSTEVDGKVTEKGGVGVGGEPRSDKTTGSLSVRVRVKSRKRKRQKGWTLQERDETFQPTNSKKSSVDFVAEESF